jgi:hypothetical protein
MVDRLIKKRVEIAPACFFHSTLKIARIRQAVRISRSVESYSTPKLIVAQYLPQSIEEQSALYI